MNYSSVASPPPTTPCALNLKKHFLLHLHNENLLPMICCFAHPSLVPFTDGMSSQGTNEHFSKEKEIIICCQNIKTFFSPLLLSINNLHAGKRPLRTSYVLPQWRHACRHLYNISNIINKSCLKMLNMSYMCANLGLCAQWIDRARQHYVTSVIGRPRGPMGRDCNSTSHLSQLCN